MPNLYLVILLLSGFALSASGFVKFKELVVRSLGDRLEIDRWLGDRADAIAQSERRVRLLNAQLKMLHESCPRLLMLPPVASVPAINAARATAQALALTQSGLRYQAEIPLLQMRMRGFRVRDGAPTTRKVNPCKITGPYTITPGAETRVHGAKAGIVVMMGETIAWRFRHEDGGRPWF
ncbi:MAG TPA: hypothetical protein VM901_09730 [Bdellovibrionota bacterium]|jgi:hypothetical protein|nr:hypothetical protein [Bdellovibrionota bacterium]